MNNTIKTLALIAVTVAAVKGIERVNKGKATLYVGDINSYPEWVKRELTEVKK